MSGSRSPASLTIFACRAMPTAAQVAELALKHRLSSVRTARPIVEGRGPWLTARVYSSLLGGRLLHGSNPQRSKTRRYADRSTDQVQLLTQRRRGSWHSVPASTLPASTRLLNEVDRGLAAAHALHVIVVGQMKAGRASLATFLRFGLRKAGNIMSESRTNKTDISFGRARHRLQSQEMGLSQVAFPITMPRGRK